MKPQAASSVQLEKTSILLAITDKGEIVYGGREIGIAGVRPLVKRMMQKEEVPVIVQADRFGVGDLQRLHRATGATSRLIEAYRRDADTAADRGRESTMCSVIAAQHISPAVFGEAVPTVGKAVMAESEGYRGIIVIGPFNCLPFRISEAILKPISMQNQMPILTFESDGFSVSPAFLRQVEVHIRQVCRSVAP